MTQRVDFDIVDGGSSVDMQVAGDAEAIDLSVEPAGKGTTDYTELENKPSIEGVTLTGDVSLEDIGAADAEDVQAAQETADAALTASGKAVRFDAAQTLTDAQKAQARGNVGAADAAEVGELKSAVNITANIDSYDFAYGNVYNGSINTDTNRIHTVDLIRVPKGAKLVSSAGFANMAIPVYTLDKKYKSNGVWVTEYTAAEDCYIRPILRKSTSNPAINTSEFSTLAATISIYYNWPTIAANALQRIDDNAASSLSVRGLSKVMGIAHRGYMGVAPENTASAFVAAAKAGFAIVETDIRFTSDGVPVLIHDATVNRTSDGTGNVADMTLEQLKALDFGSWFGADFTGEKILTLSEGLALFKRLGVKVLLENKTWGGATDATMRGAIVDAIKRCDYADNALIMYDSAGALANFGGSTALPGVPLILLQSDTSDALQERVNILAAVTDDVYVAISYANATPEKVSTILGYGAKCIIYTVETASVITDMDMGISGVISGSLNAPVVLYNAATA